MLVPHAEATIAQTRAEAAIVREVNRVRRTQGLRTVRVSRRLANVARRHSVAMLRHGQLSHDSFDGSSFVARLSSAGRASRYGETLAWAPGGSGTGARTIVSLWMQSATHRAVLMNGALRRVGIARVYGTMGGQRGHAITADFTS